MKNIQISQIKDDDFSSVEIIEENISINKKDTKSTYQDIKELISDVEGLREALFFKQEKLHIQLRGIKDKINGEKIQELYKNLDDLNIKPLGESKEVLQRNKEIYELKLINKILRYTIEIEKGNFNVLNALLKSEEKDDWRFLCFYINKTMETLETENKKKVLEISKKIQDKLISVFEEGKKFNNKTMMKSAYIGLSELDTNHTLLQTYIYDMEIFQKIYEMKHPNVDEIDIELYDEESNTFLNFINELKSSYQDNFTDLSEIFTNYDEAYKIVNKKLFYDLVFPTLENFLKGTISFVFLYSIENAYKNIHNLSIFIEAICTNFDCKVVLDEVSDRFSALCIDKERLFFEEIFNKIVNGSSTAKKYIFRNEIITFTRNYDKRISIILVIIDMFFKRSEYLYNDEDIADMLLFYSEHFNRLMEVIYEETTDKIECIIQIQKVFTSLKKYFKDDIFKMENFIQRKKLLIQNSLKWKLEQCEGRIKQIVDQIYFYRPETDLYILDYLKEQVFQSKRIKGKTQKMFIEGIFKINYENLKSRIFEIRFSESQKKNLKSYVTNIVNFAILTGEYEIISKYKYLENIVLLITVDKSNLTDVYDIFKLKINEKDLKKSIKCRKSK
ncbi:hypothetical protein P3W45_000039 [Vairimorpha bombi]